MNTLNGAASANDNKDNGNDLAKYISQDIVNAVMPGAVIIFYLDMQRPFAHISGHLFDELGYTPEEFERIYKHNPKKLLKKEDFERNTAFYNSVVQNCLPQYELKHHVYSKFGEMFLILERSSRITLCGSEPAYVSVFINITEQQHEKIQMQTLLDNVLGGVISCTYNHTNGVIEANLISDGWVALTGYSGQELKENFGNNPKHFILEQDRANTDEEYLKQSKFSEKYQLQYRIRRKNGEIMWVMDSGTTIMRDDGLTENLSIVTDINTLKENEQKLKINENRFKILSAFSNVSIYEFDVASSKYTYFENAEKMFGISNEELLLKLNSMKSGSLTNILHPDDLKVYNAARNELFNAGKVKCEVRIAKSDGIYFWCSIASTIISDDFFVTKRIIGAITDINSAKMHTEKLKLQVQTEPLTKLYNSPAAKQLVSEHLSVSKNSVSAMMLIDIDDFKSINDTMGHTFGDTILIDVSQRLKKLFEPSDILARVGGDEFLVYIQNAPSQLFAIEKAQSICDAFRFTYCGKNADYKISCSVGVAIANDTITYEDLFKKADFAMYDAKKAGKDRFALYSESTSFMQMTSAHASPDEFEHSILSENERIFELLYSTTDFTGSVNMVLSFLGQSASASRVYIFENDVDNKTAINTFDWCSAGVESGCDKIKTYDLQNPVDVYSLFDSDHVFICNDTKNLSKTASALALELNIFSFVQVAIIENACFKGFIGYDFCYKRQNQLTKQEIHALVLAAKILGTFILKHRN